MDKTPNYDTWIVMFKDNNIVGYVPTYKEADNICVYNSRYTWEYAKIFIKIKRNNNFLN